MSKQNYKPLSASKIKTFQSCSWRYYCTYVLGIPDKANFGAMQGTEAHTVFECLLNPRHRKLFEQVTYAPCSINNSPVISRHVRSYIKKVGLPADSYDKIDAMIVVGLLADFFCDAKGTGKIIEPELAFDIKNKNPEYHIKGFIDKPASYPNDFVRIVDYKSSKKQFEGDELKINVQAMMYSLAAKHLWPKCKPIVDFLFLQFPENPIQRLKFSDNQLKGFETFLADVYYRTNNFTKEDALSNLAADHGFPKPEEGFKGLLMCGYAKKPGQLKKDGTPMFHCPVKFGFEYWELCDEDGKRIKSSLENNLTPNENKGEFVVKKKYGGCVRFNKPASSQGDLF